jgi:ribA/ribD-fused uncharacterized protein
MSPITNFYGSHYFLSNFSDSAVVLNGETYPTVEHAFQAAKTFDSEQRKMIQAAPTPITARQLGRAVTLRADWEQVKFGIMYQLLKQKFARPDMAQALLSTDDAELIEGNAWGDQVWGCVKVKGQWIGKNRLGKLLMQVRSELSAEARGRP